MSEIFLLCGYVIAHYTVAPVQEDALELCQEIGELSESVGVDPYLSISLAYYESRFNVDAISDAGAIGSLQILPRYHCFEIGHDCHRLIDSNGEYIPLETDSCYSQSTSLGVCALSRYLVESLGDQVVAVARYHGGRNPSQRSVRYASTVVRFSETLRREIGGAGTNRQAPAPPSKE